MKRYSLLILIAAATTAILFACQKNEITTPDFEVSVAKDTYKVGDTVQFNFTGKPDVLTFYSGEIGSQYDAKGRFAAAGVSKLAFQSSMQQGPVPPAVSPDVLQLLVSTDLAGYDAESIKKATWTDITSRNTKWPVSLATTFTASDAIDVSDFNTAEKINIAFKFNGKPNPSFAQRKWQIQNLTLSNTLPDGTVTPLFSTFANTGWVQASLKNDLRKGTPDITDTVVNANGTITVTIRTPATLGYNAWNVGTANVSALNNPIVFRNVAGLKAVNTNGIGIVSAYPITFDPGTDLNNEENEDWLITSAIDLKRTKGDVGAVIKSAVNKSLTNYRYIYKKAGKFVVTFDAMNNDLNDAQHTVKQIEITIAP